MSTDLVGSPNESGLRSHLTRRGLLRLAGASAAALAVGFDLKGTDARSNRWSPQITAASYSSAVPVAWFTLMLDLMRRAPGFSPPVVSRALAYSGIALYEALTPGMPGYRSLAGQLPELPRIPPEPGRAALHWATVANSALATALRGLFPAEPLDIQAAIDALERDVASQVEPNVPTLIYKRSIRRGREVAEHILRWARTDGGHEGYLRNSPDDYVAPEGDGLWIPTPPGFLPALQPSWGTNRTFAIGSPAEIPVTPPPSFSSVPGSEFYRSAYEVYDAVNDLRPEQEAIARFWADDPGVTSTPPGHSFSILNQIVVQLDVHLERAAEAYVKLGMALADAFICCWHTKFEFNLVRPISYIQEHIDAGWGDQLPVETPPFPEYTSGHSVQSGAAAKVLTDLFGNVAFTDHTHDARGMAPRSFRSFDAFAAEAAISRLYGGIHYREAIDVGPGTGRSRRRAREPAGVQSARQAKGCVRLRRKHEAQRPDWFEAGAQLARSVLSVKLPAMEQKQERIPIVTAVAENKGFHPFLEADHPYIFIDSCMQAWPDADYANAHRHGVTAYGVTAWRPHATIAQALEEGMFWRLIERLHDNVIVAETADDIRRAKTDGKAALIISAQGGDWIENKLHRVEAMQRLGLRMMLPAYNTTNTICDGALDRTEGGLTRFGELVVDECNRVGVLLDCTHVGKKSTLEIIERSQKPCVFSHSNPNSVVPNPRNIDDDQIKACVAKGGVIGLAPWGPLVMKPGTTHWPTVEDFIEHVDYVAQLTGSADHVGIGTDMSLGTYPDHDHDPWGEPEYPDVAGDYTKHITGNVRSPKRAINGFSNYTEVTHFADRLLSRGYSDEDVHKILGENYLRVFEEVW